MKTTLIPDALGRLKVRVIETVRARGIPFEVLALSVFLLSICASASLAQQQGVNYDESRVPAYTLPDPLVMASGQKVTSARMWMEKRRPELLKLFETYEYGHSPGRPEGMTFHVDSVDRNALGGKATRKEVLVNFSGKKDGPKMRLLIYLPNRVPPVPKAQLGMAIWKASRLSLPMWAASFSISKPKKK